MSNEPKENLIMTASFFSSVKPVGIFLFSKIVYLKNFSCFKNTAKGNAHIFYQLGGGVHVRTNIYAFPKEKKITGKKNIQQFIASSWKRMMSRLIIAIILIISIFLSFWLVMRLQSAQFLTLFKNKCIVHFSSYVNSYK